MQEQLGQLYGYLHGMWRYRWSALFIAWAVALVGWLFVFSLPNQYAAGAVIYVDTTSIMKPLLKDLALEVDTQDELAVMTRVLLGRENLLSVIRETDMDLGVTSHTEKEGLVKQLSKAIEMKGGGRRDKSNIYEITYKGDSAEGTYKVVSVLLNNMIENTLSSGRTDTATAQKFLNTQIAEYEKRLSVAEQQLADFKKTNLGFMPDDKGSYYARLQRAQETIDATTSALNQAKQRQSELKKQLSGEVPLMDSANYQSANVVKLRKYQEQLDQLLNSYTEEHPDVKSLQATIAELKAGSETGENVEADRSVNTGTGSGQESEVEFNPVYQEIKVELSKASVEVEILKVQLSDQKNRMKRLKEDIDVIPEVEARLSKLNRDYEVTRERYLSLVERRESARLAQDAGQSSSDITFRVIEPPVTPTGPSGPPRLLFLCFALFIALGAGLAWSFLRYMLEPTFFDLKQLTDKTGLPILGAVSLYLSPEHKARRKLQLTSFLSASGLLAIVFASVIVFSNEGAALVGTVVSEFNEHMPGVNDE